MKRSMTISAPSSAPVAQHPDLLVTWMHSLADPTRLRLLSLLQEHELGVVELCEVLQMPQSTVSRHLKILADRGWIYARHRGTANLYRMHEAELDPAAVQLWQISRSQTESWAQLAHDRLRLAESLSRRRDASFFARTADRWETLRRDLYGSAFLLHALTTLLPRDLDVIDLGCGTGELVATLAPHVRRVVGVDNSQAMLESAQRRLGQRNVAPPRANLLQANLDAVPLPSTSFDAALLLLVLTYVERPQDVIAEVARLLRPGGRAVVVTLLRHDRDDFRREMHQLWAGFAPVDLSTLAKNAGLTVDACHPLVPEPRAKGPALLYALLRT